MANRYNAANKALDLSKFHADPILQDSFCALYKPIILIAVIEIIGENIPELEALSLNDNNIQILTFLKKYVDKLKNVRILHLAQNKIRDMSMLDSLIGMPLVELLLDGNPLCDRLKDKALYTSEIRNRFPKIMKLDGIELPPPISFDLAEEHTLPPSSQTFLCNAEGGATVRQFLEQYFQLLDSDNRQLLVQAYHENAVFSLTMAYPYGSKDKTSNWLNWYSTDNRNLLRVTDSDRRFKLLKKGHVSIVSFLKDMPTTSHDIMNFKVDLTVFTPLMLSLTVCGMFKEMKSGHKHSPIRSFSRTLIIIPAGNGYCICNEELHITNATEDQIKAFKSTPMPPPPAVIVTPPQVSIQNVSVPNTPLIPEVNGIDDLTKQRMVEALSVQSGMNLEWSTKCLQETEWNFDRATMVFNQLHKQGGIPAEAFVK
ncbi:hypothetical protein WA026_001749 [Henosepilachna vigintioctopunctata]|uniref:Nuclear RNA export factor 1 n=1 Tax=Henosepilachna vigintioctopunctata TaxID=420089 RepID=A0AAW1UJ51_9CUCU